MEKAFTHVEDYATFQLAPMQEIRDQKAEKAPSEASGELEESRWAVISFARCEGTGLTFAEAAALLRKLEVEGISGISIVTAEAAARVG